MKSPKITKVLNLVLKLTILVASYGYIYIRLVRNHSLESSWQGFVERWGEWEVRGALAFMLVLMLLNWSLEALKWRYLLRRMERISFYTALRAVLAGVTVSSFTPNRTGEYLGRVFVLKNTPRWRAAFATVVGSMSQLAITLVVGSLALIFFFRGYVPYGDYVSDPVFSGLMLALLLFAVLVVLLYYNIRLLEPLLLRFTRKRWTSIRSQLAVFREYRAVELSVLLGFSFARYLVFGTQFWLLLRLFGMPLDFLPGMMLIAGIYFVMSAIPTIALSELGVRGSLTVFFLELFYADQFLLANQAAFAGVSAATLIWIINLVIPALMGGIFVMQLRFFSKQNVS